VIKGIRKGLRLFVVDPRRTETTDWAEAHLAVNVGGDIALANAIGAVLVEEGLVNQGFVARSTTGFEAWAKTVARYRPEDVVHLTGVAPDVVRQAARAYGRAGKAMIAWTLGITEHHNARSTTCCR
jgi:anaerobic selenocysteine-containing dehydrogenase